MNYLLYTLYKSIGYIIIFDLRYDSFIAKKDKIRRKEDEDSSKLKEGYEEAFGICTPSEDLAGMDKNRRKEDSDSSKLKDGYEEAFGLSAPSEDQEIVLIDKQLTRLASNKAITVVSLGYTNIL